MVSKLDKNTRNAFGFYQMVFEGGEPHEAVNQFVERGYTQRKPLVGEGGPEALISYFERMADEYSSKSNEVVRSVAEGDLVSLYSHQSWADGSMYLVMDYFRFDENSKIVEHWDSTQQIQDTSGNRNTMSGKR